MSKIKLVPCPGIKKHEVLTRMMKNGETFKYIKPQSEGNFPPVFEDLHYDKNHTVNPFRLGTNQWNFRGLKYLHEIVEQKWYEDIPEGGVLCWVNDLDEYEKDCAVLILSIDGGFKEAGTCTWKYAEPVLPSECYQGEV